MAACFVLYQYKISWGVLHPTQANLQHNTNTLNKCVLLMKHLEYVSSLLAHALFRTSTRSAVAFFILHRQIYSIPPTLWSNLSSFCSILHISSFMVTSLWAHALLRTSTRLAVAFFKLHRQTYSIPKHFEHVYPLDVAFYIFPVVWCAPYGPMLCLEPVPDQLWRSSPFTGKPTAYPNFLTWISF